MRFQPEPEHRHGRTPRTGVVLVNLGTPEAPNAAALRRYLAEFLSDTRVVEIPSVVWKPLLHGVILRTRPAKSAAKYASIWREVPAGTPVAEGAPLLHFSRLQAQGVAQRLSQRGHEVQVRLAMRYGQPAVAQVLDALKAEGCERLLILPLYPQYAAATTASVVDAVAEWARRIRWQPELRFVASYHDEPGYTAALAASVRAHWAAHGRGDKLLMSFHGVPERSLHLGDPYHCQCHKTARLLREALGLAHDEALVTFQSRLGRARWLQPYTEPTVRALAAQGLKSIDAICPGFAADNLETLEEIGIEVREAFLGSGGQRFELIPCLNDRDDHLDLLADLAERHLQGWPTRPEALNRLAAERQAQAAHADAMARSSRGHEGG